MNPDTKWAGQVRHYFEETGSTNDDCKKIMLEGAPHGVLVTADSQTAGKGRRGRNWISLPGANIFMSLGLRPAFPADKASMLTLVMALAAARGIEEVSGLKTGIKWPNDIVVNKKKVCGILTEMHIVKEEAYSVVIGVGINVNQKTFDEEICAKATSLFMEKKETLDRETLINRIMEHFERYYESFVKTCDLSSLMAEYEEKLVNKNAPVRVLEPGGEYNATATGINSFGELLVKKEDGTTAAVYAGEVSVRGIYGYV